MIKDIKNITPKYLTKIFITNGVLTSGKITNINTIKEDMIPSISSNWHLKLTYSKSSKGEKPSEIYLKLGSEDRSKTEIEFYQFLKQRKIQSEIFAKCYFAEYCSKEKSTILILKDYNSLQMYPIDIVAFNPRENVPDDEYYFMMVELLAEFHAMWWEDKVLYENEDHLSISELWNTEEKIVSFIAQNKKLWEGFYKKENSWITNEDKSIFKRSLKNTFDAWKKHFDKRINKRKHFTLTHGSCYIQQFLCLYGDVKSKIVNFEKLMIGNPAYDLVHLLIERINPAQRNYNDREKRLLKHYHKSLVKFGVKNYSFNELITDYKMMVILRIFHSLSDYKELGNEDPYWWYEYQNINHAFIDLKCDELYSNIEKQNKKRK